MARRKGFGNPLSKALGEVLDKVAPEVVDSIMDIAGGPSKRRKSPTSRSSRSTDWATRAPAPAPTRSSKRR
ncbi:MAG TPA: hypothetical protein VEG38_15065 [Acidimicrobiia bacterium]|nr:hypothetical protein [Acidimicrobiia bacterium]